jgi:two-component system, LytTR family, sensor kinase
MPRWLRRTLLLSALWSIPGLIIATSMYVVMDLKGDPMGFGEALLWRLPPWQVWALATPLIVYLGRRWSPARARWWQWIPIHLAANALIGAGELTVYSLAGRAIDMEPFHEPLLDLVPFMLLKSTWLELLLYWGVIGIDRGLAYQRRYREAAVRESQLEARLVEAQLDALKMQLQPHFLFNTINAVTVLMRKGESASAIRMLGGLSELLRRSLSSLRVEFVALGEELDFVTRYLDIETTRFPDRLRTRLEIEPSAQRAKVPNLILQPIVENAIKHGIAPRISGGQIAINARVSDGRLRIEVRDDGVGLRDAAATAGHGMGLAHVRKRLSQLYGADHSFTLAPAEGGGTVATVELPFQEVA